MIAYLAYLFQHNLQTLTLQSFLSISFFGLTYILFSNQFMSQEALLSVVFFCSIFHVHQASKAFEEDIEDGSFDVASSLFKSSFNYIIIRSFLLILINGAILWGSFGLIVYILKINHILIAFYIIYILHLFLFFISIQILITLTHFRIDSLALFALNMPFFIPYYLSLMHLPIENIQMYWIYGGAMIQFGTFILITEYSPYYRNR